MINNLLSNAIRHTPPGGQIKITMNKNTLEFTNSGSDALDTKRLFKRFSLVSKEKVGSGLGLAIVKEIANQCNWIVQYSFQNNLHSFSVNL